MSGGSGSGSDSVCMSSVPLSAKGTPPREYNELPAINRQLIQIIEHCSLRMQVMMVDAQAKRRGAKESVGRRGDSFLMDNGLAQFDLMVELKMTKIFKVEAATKY